ncbi:MAG: phosphate ABC transporter substrate-binding protein [Nitrospinae bacterium]|nr:phosphate ABC transporter substrate-binding protein [Nitrospinota bacterium]
MPLTVPVKTVVLISLILLAGAVAMIFRPGEGTQVFADETTVIRVAGSTTVLPIVSRAAERFQSRHPSVKITVNTGGSGVGIHGAGTRRFDIGLASREISPKEKHRYASSDLRTTVIGRDAVACVVSSEVFHAGVQALSKQQIRDIYLGKITHWQQVGGPDRPIIVIDKEVHRGTRHVFMQYLFGKSNARAPGARLVTGSNNEEQAKIAQSNSAIGMLSVAWINDEVVGIGIRDGERVIHPTLDNVRNGRFPIVRNLNLITVGEPQGAVKQFIDYLLSEEGQQQVADSGYIPVQSPHAVSRVAGSHSK